MRYRAVIFDLGGVVLGSPLHAIADYERELGIPGGFVNRVVVDAGPQGAWSRLERGELGMEDFYPAFESDCRQRGQQISARELMVRVHTSALPRPAMLEAIRRIRRRELMAAALTNNWSHEENDSSGLRPHFDVFVESSQTGMRKPDPRIYRHTCGLMRVEPDEAIFLDDIGGNLKPARAMGIRTIKVEDPDAALAELAGELGFELGD